MGPRRGPAEGQRRGVAAAQGAQGDPERGRRGRSRGRSTRRERRSASHPRPLPRREWGGKAGGPRWEEGQAAAPPPPERGKEKGSRGRRREGSSGRGRPAGPAPERAASRGGGRGPEGGERGRDAGSRTPAGAGLPPPPFLPAPERGVSRLPRPECGGRAWGERASGAGSRGRRRSCARRGGLLPARLGEGRKGRKKRGRAREARRSDCPGGWCGGISHPELKSTIIIQTINNKGQFSWPGERESRGETGRSDSSVSWRLRQEKISEPGRGGAKQN